MIIKFKIYRAWHHDEDKEQKIADREKKIADALAQFPGVRQEDDFYYADVEDFMRVRELLPKNTYEDTAISEFNEFKLPGKTDALSSIEARLAELAAAIGKPRGEFDVNHEVNRYPLFNAHVNGPISGPHLLAINDTCLLEDACTDTLQKHLHDGWRILAVCPQEARRPDYVLGRHIPFNYDLADYAGRG